MDVSPTHLEVLDVSKSMDEEALTNIPMDAIATDSKPPEDGKEMVKDGDGQGEYSGKPSIILNLTIIKQNMSQDNGLKIISMYI